MLKNQIEDIFLNLLSKQSSTGGKLINLFDKKIPKMNFKVLESNSDRMLYHEKIRNKTAKIYEKLKRIEEEYKSFQNKIKNKLTSLDFLYSKASQYNLNLIT